MFGYVRPPLDKLSGEDAARFRRLYCGLCHTLDRRCGFAARWILNYDFTFLALLLSGAEEGESVCRRCVAHPLRARPCVSGGPALELAADESVILAYWQLRDGVADHGFWKGLRYRALSRALHPAYRRAAAARPGFDRGTREQLRRLAELEREYCASLDAAADTFGTLLSGAAEYGGEERQRRILRQMLYHLGRWIYLVDAADDLRRDDAAGSYNPVALRYGLHGGEWDGESRREFAKTLDLSIHMIASAYELGEFGVWSGILEATVYDGLFGVGKAVLEGRFSASDRKTEKRLARKLHE